MTVMTVGELGADEVRALLGRYGVGFVEVDDEAPIPYSFWGAPEAGIRGTALYVRADTPVHSLLHELAHLVCMPSDRRAQLERDAGGDDEEECAVCYLQVLLAEWLPAFGRARCLDDMDAWGYSFREGRARRWFAGDGASARMWLEVQGLIDAASAPIWRLRSD